MYKLREERLRNFYSIGDMDSPGLAPTKTPLTPSHGESLADQSFQSFKTKEIRDSESPSREFQISRGGIVTPDTSGWNIVTSSEVSPDGRARKTESIATTEGTQLLPGGHAEFAGKNEHMMKTSHQGDDRNYMKTADERSATQFHETSVTGDDKSGRIEKKSSTTSSSSRVTTSKFSSTSDDFPEQIIDHRNVAIEPEAFRDARRSSTIREQQQAQHQVRTQQQRQEHHQRVHNERYLTDNSTNTQATTNQSEITKLENQNIQKEVDLLAQQPGILISRSVDYPDPNTKVITETKQLPDGTTVTTRKYETKSASSKTFRSSSNQQHSTTSRTTVEDRAQRNHVEYIKDDDVENIKRVQQQQLPQQNQRPFRNDEVDDTVQRKTRSEKITTEHTTNRRSSVQSVDTTDRSVRRENLTDQVENTLMDKTSHRTVKKDLSQQYKNQDFIDTEREYKPVADHPGHVPSHIRTEHISTTYKTDTDRTIEDSKTSAPAAGKPSYNVQKPSGQQPSSPTKEKRMAPSSNEPREGYPGERYIPVDTSEYPSDKPSGLHRPQPSTGRPHIETPSSTPAAGKPSYNIQPAGKPSYTKTVQKSQNIQQTKQTQQSRDVREIRVEHTSTDHEMDYPAGKPSYSPQFPKELPNTSTDHTPRPHGREITTRTTVTRSYGPNDSQPDAPDNHRTFPSQEPTEGRQIPNDFHNKVNQRETTTTTTTTRSYHDSSHPQQPQPHIQSPSKPSEREIHITRTYEPSDSKPDYTISEPNYEPQYPQSPIGHSPKSHERQTVTTTTTKTRVDEHETHPREVPRYSPQRQQRYHDTPQVGERQIPINRSYQPEDDKPEYPAGKPSYTPQMHPDSYQSPQQKQVPNKSSERDIPTDYDHPAGKPSYSAPRRESYEPKHPYNRESPQNQRRSENIGDSYPEENYPELQMPNRSTPRDQSRPQYVRRPSEESYVSVSTVRTNNTNTSKKISVEVDAAHDAFARSLRCASPSDRGSVKSLRTSTTSIRSFTSPEKRSPRDRRTQRSPSRDSITYSESSKISTSTVTKGKSTPKESNRSPKKPTDTPLSKRPTKEQHLIPKDKHVGPKDTNRSNEPVSPNKRPSEAISPKNQPVGTRPNDRPSIHPSNETVDITTTRKDTTHLATTTKEVNEYPGEKDVPTTPTFPVKPKPTQPSPKKEIRSPSRLIESPTTIKTTATKNAPKSQHPPEKVPISTIGTTQKPSRPNTITTGNRTVVTKSSKEPKTPQQFGKKLHPDSKKGSRSPYSSPERSSRPSNRESPTDANKSPRKPSSANRTPAAEIPSDHAHNITKLTKTVREENIITRDEKLPSRGTRKPSGKHPRGSDDEGFEPESPRSSSPTSSVSDLVYHKSPEEQLEDVAMKTTIATTKRTTTTDEFINKEREDVETNRKKKVTRVDDEKFKSPERQYPKEGGNYPVEVERYDADYPRQTSPRRELPEKYPETSSRDEIYQRPGSQSPNDHHPYGRNTDNPRDQSPEGNFKHPTDKEDTREPFYLIQPRPVDNDGPKKPDDIKKPNSRSQGTRSETYEERCRKILGMDRTETIDTTEETIIRRKPEPNGIDLIAHERTVEERNRDARKTKPSSRGSSPGKMQPKQREPTRQDIPHDTDEYFVEEEKTVRTINTKSMPHGGRPEYATPNRSSPDKQTRIVTTTSPTRKQPEISPKDNKVERSPDRNLRRMHPTGSPETSPSRIPVNRKTSPTHSPTRKQFTPTSPNKTTREKSPVFSPYKQQPEYSPSRDVDPYEQKPSSGKKPSRGYSPDHVSKEREPSPSGAYTTRKETVVTTTKTITKSPQRVSPDRSPVRKSPGQGFERKSPKSVSPERSPIREPSSYPDRSSHVPRTPSPTSKVAPNRHVSPSNRTNEMKPSRQSPFRSPTRSPSPSTKYTETVTIVTQRGPKGTPSSPRTKQKVNEPNVRPNHITTAKIHISPPAERKPSSIDIEKSRKIPHAKTVQTPKTTREEITTTRISKSIVPRATSSQNAPKLKKITNKPRSTEVIKGQEKVPKHRRPEEDTEEEEDSEVVSDAEDITHIIETKTEVRHTPSKQPGKRHPITERKDSAPVYKTTTVDKDKMTRSTSESVIKTTAQRNKPEINHPTEKDSPRKKSLDKKRPVKCMSTKTINLTTTDKIINSEEMEDVIIDIQQAKSSREPSPDRMVPMPVRHDLDTGIPRYPDQVQEPEDETRRRPKVKDIPIFEEDTDEYIRCHISEVDEQVDQVEKRKSVRHTKKEEDDETTVTTTQVTTQRALSPNKDHTRKPETTEPDDDYRLSVHDKVAKFITTAEEVRKPKPSTPFQRASHPDDLEPDDCLLSVNDKVSKFLTTAETITKPMKSTSIPQRSQRPNMDEIDDKLRDDECVLSVSEKVNKFTTSVDKLVEETSQRTPKLVAKVERQVSRKDERVGDTDEVPKQPMEPVEARRVSRTSVRDRYQPGQPNAGEKPKPSSIRNTEVIKKVKSVFETNEVSNPKQKDILSRPSVWEDKRNTPEVKLQDIGVHRPFDEETEEIIQRERSRSRSPGDYEEEPSRNKSPRIQRTSNTMTDSVSSKKNLFESQITKKSSTVKTKQISTREPNDLNKQETKVQKEITKKHRPQEVSPSRSYKSPLTDKGTRKVDEGYVEDVTTETTTIVHRKERRSPSRPCEYYSPERDSRSPVRYMDSSPTRTPSGTSKDQLPSTQRKVGGISPSRKSQSSPSRSPSKRPDDIPVKNRPRHLDEKSSPISSKSAPRTEQTRSKIMTKPSEPSPTRVPTSSKSVPQAADHHTPSHRPSYMEPTISSLEHRRDSLEIVRHSSGPDLSNASSRQDLDLLPPSGGVPSYMEHTISSIEHRRDSLEISKTHSRRTSHDSLHNVDSQPKSAKFGVELKRTDLRDSTSRRKSSSSEVPHIEEIFDLELLEKMYETVVGYEQRRRIRAQIRVVKKMIEEGTLKQSTTSTITTKTITRKTSETSPVRKSVTQTTRRTEISPDRHDTKTHPRRADDTKSTSSRFIESESRHITHHEKKSTVRERSISPQGKVRGVATTTVEVRKTGNRTTAKRPEPKPLEKPVWATKNILKKPSDNDRAAVKQSTTTTKVQRQIVTRDDADCITSSYGIGPTDDDGKPLFGIRALKKKPQKPGETTKVTGSIVTESYYSENGAPPVGERKVTVYSNSPEDINDYEYFVDQKDRSDAVARERTSKGGITSVTRVQKIGKPDDAEFADLAAITDGKTTTTTKQTKVVRKGSVKEMSEKFTRKGSSTSITDKSGSSQFPKAGLILRTQNYSSTENEDPADECNVEIRTTRKQTRTQMVTESDSDAEQRRVSRTSKTFLNSNGEKVTGVDDVLDRMRNADNVIEDGDSAEDREARSLLNKFLGASVLMSGVESMVPKEVITRQVVDSPGKHEVKTTRITKTVTSGSSSSPVARKTCDIEEIWDEEYLKQLLEQSTNYEERRRIRARIRQIMAEKEACTDIAASVKAELKSEQQGKTVIKSEKEVIKAGVNDESETESEYEEIEIVEEVTDDSSAEVEEEDEEEGEEEGGEEEEDKIEEEGHEVSNESSEEEVEEESKPAPIKSDSKITEVHIVAKREEKTTNVAPNNSTSESSKLKQEQELEAKEQRTCTTETTKTEQKDGAEVTTTTRVTTRTIASAPKPVSPFAKFRQLDKQNSQNSPLTPSSPMTPGGTNRGAPLFQFTDPALCARAATVKEQLLQWCQMKTKEYENVQITNFSTCWSDGLAFCALIHHFLPDAFDYSKLTPKERRYNFELAFRVADEKAGIAPLLDVEDMVTMRKPDWKCVFTYVQTIFRRFRNCA
ncbi:serine/arginine repetitive matrix protein 2 isoform X2 [Hermetia illucens]|nr:serine/arginine repetitive matrix protein 2 isoform X2 [Hermetia illucens]